MMSDDKPKEQIIERLFWDCQNERHNECAREKIISFGVKLKCICICGHPGERVVRNSW